MPDAAVRFRDVTFGFGKPTPLFQGISCSLANTTDAGKIIALMGPSGVGKTTFCDLALGIRQPQKGSITFAPTNANIAVIPQKAILFDELDVKENISCLKYSRTLGKTFKEERIQHAVDSLGLADVLRSGTRPDALSGGEAQRVMLARIQTINCDVLILDEPCSFLDNRVKDSFLAGLRATIDESRLLALMVTHVWDEAREIADEVLFFHQAPGKPVTLHCLTVAEAQRCPPTIDAMYGIHWPNCVVLALDGMPPFHTLSEQPIPHDARFVGLHLDERAQSSNDAWACNLWRRVARSSGVNRASGPIAGGTLGDGACVIANFYNRDEVLVKVNGDPPR